MKNYKVFLLALVGSFALMSCSKDGDDLGELNPDNPSVNQPGASSVQNMNDEVSTRPAYSPRR